MSGDSTTKKKKGRSSLARELEGLLQPQATMPDPEMIDTMDTAKVGKKGMFGLYDLESSAPLVAKGKLLRGIEDTSRPEYQGKKSSRKDIFEQHDDDELDSGSEVDSVESDSKVDELREKMYSAAMESDEGEEDAESSDSDEENEEEDGGENMKLVRSSHSEVDPALKGKHTRNQQQLFGQLLGVRIKLQPLVQAANRFPFPDSRSKGVYKSCDSGFDKTVQSLKGFLSTLLDMRQSLSSQNPELQNVKSMTREGKGPSRKRSFLEMDSQNIWNTIEKQESDLHPYHAATLNKWQRKANLGMRLNSKSLKAINQDLMVQVDQVMENTDRLRQRSQHLDPNTKVFGESQLQDTDTSLVCEDVYNDSQFYQHLLKEFITSTSGKAVDIGKGSRTGRKHVKKANVDLRASKGRKIRYTVHDKLVNFIAPNPTFGTSMDGLHHVDSTQLFRSLFQ